jgi:hypothetical protein
MGITIEDPKRNDPVVDLRSHQRMGTTFHQFAQSAANEIGGRFAAENKQHVVGSTPIPDYPQLPASSPWSRDFVPDEMPLGYRIDDGPDRSLEPTVAQGTGDPAAPLVGSPLSRGFRRVR